VEAGQLITQKELMRTLRQEVPDGMKNKNWFRQRGRKINLS
jgi:hypothetical protein